MNSGPSGFSIADPRLAGLGGNLRPTTDPHPHMRQPEIATVIQEFDSDAQLKERIIKSEPGNQIFTPDTISFIRKNNLNWAGCRMALLRVKPEINQLD